MKWAVENRKTRIENERPIKKKTAHAFSHIQSILKISRPKHQK